MPGARRQREADAAPLALLLLRASRWFDRELRARLHARGWPALTAAQSLVFAHLDADGTPPAELARRLGTSRQATQQLVAGLAALDLLVTAPDPSRANGRRVRTTAAGRRLAADARRELAGMERELGDEDADALRGLLARLRLG